MTIAVIADIVASRKLADRAAAQKLLAETVHRVQRAHAVSPVPPSAAGGERLQDEVSARRLLATS